MTTAADWLAARWRRHEKLLRFLIVGGVNTLFGLSLYPLLLYFSPTLHRHYLVALAIAQGLSLCFAFAMYKLTVFRSQGNVVSEAGTFASFYAVVYTLNWIALPVLVEWARISPSIAQVGFTVVTVVGSYFWHSRLTFRRDTGAPY